jgi:hypothetical protein
MRPVTVLPLADNNAPAVRHHNLDSTTARSGALLRPLRHDHRRHESGKVAKPPFAIRLALGEQELVGNPMPTRRRRCQPRSRKTLLDYPQLFRRRKQNFRRTASPMLYIKRCILSVSSNGYLLHQVLDLGFRPSGQANSLGTRNSSHHSMSGSLRMRPPTQDPGSACYAGPTAPCRAALGLDR